jgi:prevent-host-death family protein
MEAAVVKKASAAQAKSQFSALMAEVAHGGKRVVIERHGKPLAALVSVSDLERLEEGLTARPQGAMALVGAWRAVDEQKLDALICGIYEARLQDTGRSVQIDALRTF